jgi:hypothetical protein
MRVMGDFGIVDGQVLEEVRALKYLRNLIKRKNKINEGLEMMTAQAIMLLWFTTYF